MKLQKNLKNYNQVEWDMYFKTSLIYNTTGVIITTYSILINNISFLKFNKWLKEKI